MQNILLTTGYQQPNLSKLQYGNVKKRIIQSCGSVEHFKVINEQHGSTLLVDKQVSQKRYSAQDQQSLKFNLTSLLNKKLQSYSKDAHNTQNHKLYQCSINNFNPIQLIPKQASSDKLPYLNRFRSLSEGSAFKRLASAKPAILNRKRSVTGQISQPHLNTQNQQLIHSQNYFDVNQALCVSNYLSCNTDRKQSSNKENKQTYNFEGLQSEKLPNFSKIAQVQVPHTKRLSNFQLLCEKNNNQTRYIANSQNQQSKNESLLFTKYNKTVQPFQVRKRGVSISDNSPFALIKTLNTQMSTTESMFLTENTENKSTQLFENRNSLEEIISQNEQDIKQKINSKDVDKNLAFNLKRLQFDKFFPKCGLTQKLKTYYEQIEKDYQDQYKKNLEKVRRVEIPEYQKTILRMIRQAQKKEVNIQSEYQSFNFNDSKLKYK
ncbi:hypothetical protein TTHERM_00046800 (macronuclear) [Tetrahymena thermophila SB210]|uniref:Uncharacterized protein n=1 Tax=Tetrahymena thermophila (strain SB210) TaxID=312017 RepID=Q23DL1_TETTS|nr:hypothetical protein TTHERM_00046800 [Tetrahymena thermophila SB210]EAR94340.1 hypothetical protein TTHERM_00046800 [Tetrahymena thermophila SB210]|eukprot:XP_001014675.1 hypothetical protein TTHERM_00046800 [Tetrahymena thermophila SB210]